MSKALHSFASRPNVTEMAANLWDALTVPGVHWSARLGFFKLSDVNTCLHNNGMSQCGAMLFSFFECDCIIATVPSFVTRKLSSGLD